MITTVDSSVIIELLVDESGKADSSESALRQARKEGSLIICETVLAEVAPILGDKGDLEEFLRDWEFTFQPASMESSILAGSLFRLYLGRGGKRGRVVADFLVGAHAQVFSNRLLTRDRGFYRDYFKGLSIWNP